MNKFKDGDRVIVLMAGFFKPNEPRNTGIVFSVPTRICPWYVVIIDGLRYGFDEDEIELAKNQIILDIIKDL